MKSPYKKSDFAVYLTFSVNIKLQTFEGIMKKTIYLKLEL